MNKMVPLTAFCALCIGLAPIGAAALTVVQNRDISISALIGVQTVGDFDAFSAAGVLNSVSLSWDLSASWDVTVNQCATFDDCEPSNYFLYLSGSNEFAGLFEQDSDNAGFTNSTNTEQFGSVSTGLFNTQILANTADFLGAGPIGSLAVSTGRDGAMYADSGSTSGSTSGTLTLTYDYAPAVVPLPAAGFLLLGGLAGLGALARRRQS